MSSITPRTVVMTPEAARLLRSKCEIASKVSGVAGTLPVARRATRGHCTVWLAPCTAVPTALVMEA